MAEFREHPSLACVWDGARLAPSPDAAEADVTVWFALPPVPEASADEQVWEALRASSAGDGLYVVRGCSVLFSGVSFGDVVRAIPSAEGALAVTEIVERRGFESARVWFEDGEDSWRVPTEELAAMGAIVDVYTEKLVGISWPGSIDLGSRLRQLEGERRLAFAT